MATVAVAVAVGRAAGAGAGERAWAGAGAAENAVLADAKAAAGVSTSSRRGRLDAADGEAPTVAVSAGRGAGVGACVASESVSDWSACSADGPPPGEVEAACEPLPDEEARWPSPCGAVSVTGSASVKMLGAHPSVMNWPSPPAVAAAAAASSGVLKPPLWYAALPTVPVAHLEHRPQLEKTAKPWYGDQ